MADITLIPLAPEDQEQFILDNQEAFNYGALEEFGRRNEEFEEDEQIISKDTIQQSIYIGYATWCAVEKMHPEVKVWETMTPYFETRNIHFYVNRCGFHIVEFFNSHHSNPNDSDMADEGSETRDEGMFRFEKRMDSSYKTDPLPQRLDK